MPDVKGITVTENGVTKTVAKMSILHNGITKETVFAYKVTFDTNITASGSQYYVSGQSVTVITPNARWVVAGSTLGTLPSIGNTTYTLSGITYTIYVSGWYTNKACTGTAISASTVPTGNVTYYAKWVMTANVGIGNGAVVPMFANGVTWAAYSNGGGRSASSIKIYQGSGSSSGGAILVSGSTVGMCMSAPGAARNYNSHTYSASEVRGKTVTLGTWSISIPGCTSYSVTTPNSSPTNNAIFNLGLDSTIKPNTSGSYTVFNTGGRKCIVSWPKISSSKKDVTATFYWNDNSVGSYTICQLHYSVAVQSWYIDSYGSSRNTTFASGVTGAAAGGFGVTKMSDGNGSWQTSVAAASGSDASQSCTVIA